MPTLSLALTLVTLWATHGACQRVTPTTALGSVTAAPNSAPPNDFLAPVSYSGTFTYTTPTTLWARPTFTPAPASNLPSCSDYATLCPSLDHQICADSQQRTYGVICDARFAGTIITSSGKKEKMKARGEEAKGGLKKRGYSRTLDNCAGYCDMFDSESCVGVDFDGAGYCKAYAVVFGTLAAVGEVALVRQS